MLIYFRISFGDSEYKTIALDNVYYLSNLKLSNNNQSENLDECMEMFNLMTP